MAKIPLKKGTAPRVAKKAAVEEVTGVDESSSPAASPVVLGTLGKFTFTMSPVPVAPPPNFRAASSRELPFKTWFPHMKHNQPVFLPKAWWTAPASDGGRGVAEDRVTSPYVRAKVRDAFNKWRDLDASRAGHALILVERKAGDSDGEYTEDGFSLYIQITEPA